jgi:PAS domain S-box-containing protein
MTHPPRAASALLPAATVTLAGAVFIFQTMLTIKLSVAVFYVVVLLLAARFCSPRAIVAVGIGCMGLTVASFFAHGPAAFARGPSGVEANGLRLVMSVAVVGLATFLVADRKRAEAALRHSEERWRSLFETSSAGMALFGLDGVCTAANPALQRILGRSEQEIVGQNVLELNHPDERAATAAALARYRAGTLSERNVEKKYLKKDGTPVWLNITNTLAPATEIAPSVVQAVYVDVTGRVQAEAALRASEARWRAIFDSAAVGIATGDLAGGIFGINPTFQKMLGYTEDELRQLTLFDFTHEEDRAETRRLLALNTTGGQAGYRVEKRYRRKDGGTLWADVSTSVIPATDDSPGFLGVMAVDITDRKQAEAALRVSEERWRRIFATSAAGMATARLDGVFTAANPALQRMLERSEDEIVGRTAMEISHEDERVTTDDVVATFRRGLMQEYHVEKRYLKNDGSPVWLNITTTVVPATETDAAFLQAIYVDITDRKRAEDALRQSEAYLNEVFETLPDRVSIVGLDYRYQRVNSEYERRTGFPAAQIAGMHIADLIGAAAFDEIVKPELQRCFAGEPVTFEYWLDLPNSGRRYHETRYSPLFLGDTDRPGAVLSIGRDLTEYMLAQEALQQAQADLARLNRAMVLGQMTASIAHEINQPIGAVITNASAGLRWLGAPRPALDEVRQALDRIVRDGTRAGEVIGRIRALVRKVPPRRERLDLNDTVRDTVALTQTEMQRNAIKMQTRLDQGLPFVLADRVQLQQVVINLVVNAIEAMSGIDDGPRELIVRSGAGAANDVFVEVQDTGPGLDPETLEQVFRSFYTTKPDGIGMGLAISQSIAEAHGGRLSAGANTPRGAIFRLTLPTEETLAKSLRRSSASSDSAQGEVPSDGAAAPNV